MKIVKLIADNFKRLQAVEINTAGSVVQITGRNGAGKSSVLDAIEAAFGGARHYPEQPIRRGATGARVVVETDQIRVTRKWTEKGDSLVVESLEGATFRKPQEMLDKLTAGLTFDPLAFARMRGKDQAQLLRQVTGLDTAELDRRRRETYDARTRVNHEVKQLEAQLAAHQVPDDPGPVGEERDLAAIAGKKADAERRRAGIATARAEAERLRKESLAAAAEVERLRRALEAAVAKEAELRGLYEAGRKALEGVTEPDTSAVDAEIAEAREHNAAVRQRQQQADRRNIALAQRRRLEEGLSAKRKEADKLTVDLEWIDADKQALLEAAQFPVPGMGVEGDEVTVNGVPFSQASTAEQIRVGLAIGAALNPKLRVVLVRDGSLLDDGSMAVLGRWAEENDFQVILEKVAGNSPMGIVIEDGMVVAPKEAEPAAVGEK